MQSTAIQSKNRQINGRTSRRTAGEKIWESDKSGCERRRRKKEEMEEEEEEEEEYEEEEKSEVKE